MTRTKKPVFPVVTRKVTSVSSGVPEELRLVRINEEGHGIYQRGRIRDSILKFGFDDRGEMVEVQL